MGNFSEDKRSAETDEAMADPELTGDAERFAGRGEAGAAEDQARSTTEASEPRWLQEKAELQDRILRVQAEMENMRRRKDREQQDSLRFANQPLLVDLLPVIDNIERAIDAAEQSKDGGGLLQGFKMVHQMLMAAIEKHHCTRVPAAGENFDPTMHEALLQTPSQDVPAGKVTHVNQHGYQLNGRVIRPAQVIVSSGPPSSS